MVMKRGIILVLACWIASPALCQQYEDLRHSMVRKQIQARGITHRPVLEAMRKVPRHLFVPAQYQKYAYEDTPLPIGKGQTISQPFIVASMTQLLQPRPDDRILEIGTGSGYQAAVLGEIAREVYTIEIVQALGERAKKLLDSLGYSNVKVTIGDGYKGLEAKAPFDGIIVTAAPDEIPPPLIEQLKEGGRMVIPVGKPGAVQTLTLVEKRNGKIIKTGQERVRFVPFTRETE